MPFCKKKLFIVQQSIFSNIPLTNSLNINCTDRLIVPADRVPVESERTRRGHRADSDDQCYVENS